MQNTQQAIQCWIDKRKMQTQEIQTSLKPTSCFECFSTNGPDNKNNRHRFLQSFDHKHGNAFKEFLYHSQLNFFYNIEQIF